MIYNKKNKINKNTCDLDITSIINKYNFQGLLGRYCYAREMIKYISAHTVFISIKKLSKNTAFITLNFSGVKQVTKYFNKTFHKKSILLSNKNLRNLINYSMFSRLVSYCSYIFF